MKKIILGIFTILTITACSKYSYPRDKETSDKGGAIIDTSKGFLLSEIIFDGTTHLNDWNTNTLKQINSYYLDTKEPVLFNYYLDRDIYRLVVQENQKAPLILSLNRGEKDKSWLVSKRILKGDSLNVSNKLVADLTLQQPSLWVNFDVMSKELSRKDLQTFDSIFQKIDFFNLPNNELKNEYESYYLLEVHQKDKYWYVYRKFDDQTLKELVTYMKSFSRF